MAPLPVGQDAPWHAPWCALGASAQELQLDFCLPTGQSFRWRKTGDGQYTGMIGDRLVCLRQQDDDVLYCVLARGSDAPPASDGAALRDYFNLDTRLGDLATGWAESCSRYRDVSPHFPGARMLRQDPLECLFQFICSSNNHISRIHGMVERLCSAYGTPLGPSIKAEAGAGKSSPQTAGNVGAAAGADATSSGLSYYAFPTLEQLSKATEEELRAAGFGYRARFIVGTTQALLAKPGGGRQWLLGLRQVGLEEAVAALTELPGIGPKVAACICLFSLDKHQAIPVDTHVWQIAVRYYCPQLRGKSLTKKVHAEVQQVFIGRFGPYAGWAHNTLFISELASQQHRLPENLRQVKAAAAGRRRRGRQDTAESDDAGADSSGDGDGSGAGRDGEGISTPQEKSRRGAGHGKQQGRKAAVVADERTSGSAESEDGGAACAAVPDGQADVGSPASRSVRRRGAPPAQPRKREKSKKTDLPAAAAAAPEYGLRDFDDLVT